MVQVGWLVLGATVIVAAARAGHSAQAYKVAVTALAALMLLGGAAVNLWWLLRGSSYDSFADGSSFEFVRSTWRSLVLPHEAIFIGLLIAFETTTGVLVLLGGRARDVALWALVAFFVAVVSFSFWYLLWSVPMIAALVRLWEVGRRRAPSYRGRHVREVAEARG
ncbi:MAG: hypothetical protein ACTHKG_20240 [Nocardioides sp.]